MQTNKILIVAISLAGIFAVNTASADPTSMETVSLNFGKVSMSKSKKKDNVRKSAIKMVKKAKHDTVKNAISNVR